MVESLFNKVADLRPPVKFRKFLRAPVLKIMFERLLLCKLDIDINISIKRKSKIFLRVVNEFQALLLGAENENLRRLEKHICRYKEDKIYLKQTRDVITKRNGYINF